MTQEHITKSGKVLTDADLDELAAEAETGYDPGGFIPKMVRLPNLFRLGDHRLHSGDEAYFKIDCDALTEDDIECCAAIVFRYFRELHRAFGCVHGIPKGGTRLGNALMEGITSGSKGCLVVDDVFTTGYSFERARTQLMDTHPMETTFMGVAIFARYPAFSWIFSLFSFNGMN